MAAGRWTKGGRTVIVIAADAGFNEADHPRAENGQFGSGGGGSAGGGSSSNSAGRSIKNSKGESFQVNTVEHNGTQVYEIRRGSEVVGVAQMASKSAQGQQGPYVAKIDINREYRSQGLASALYDEIEEHLGQKLRPSPGAQSDGGRALWSKRRGGALDPISLQKQAQARVEELLQESSKALSEGNREAWTKAQADLKEAYEAERQAVEASLSQ